MKFVADVSSSTRSRREPVSIASMIAAAWLVEPDAFGVLKAAVGVPPGRPSMKGEMSTPAMDRPSSARTFTASIRGDDELPPVVGSVIPDAGLQGAQRVCSYRESHPRPRA